MASKERKCAVVTGGSRGIGRGCALALAIDGFDVVVNYVHDSSEDSAAEVVAEASSYGVHAIAVKADISDFREAEHLACTAADTFEHVDVLVCNAGIIRDSMLFKMDESQFDDVVNVDLKGVFNAARFIVPPMAQAGHGRVITLSSIAGITGNKGQVNYAAAKAGVIGMTKSIAREYAKFHVTANVIAPGFIETDMTSSLGKKFIDAAQANIPLGRIGTTEDIGNVVAFLASDRASYITGQVIPVDGGLTI